MQYLEESITLKLDPWAASSLLQKAIRRSHTGLALHAVSELYRYRGKSVFRRLINIAFEDVGIANPGLVAEVTFLGLDAKARAVLGSDLELLLDLTSQLSASLKDRCTDYLWNWTLRSEGGQAAQHDLRERSFDELAELAADPEKAVLTRSAATLIACTKDEKMLFRAPLERFLEITAARFPSPLIEAVRQAAQKSLGSYIVMAPLLWAALQTAKPWTGYSEKYLPVGETVGGVPLYTFDKHTSIGKRAIRRFVKENDAVRDAVSKWAPAVSPEDVAAMAAFYVDAAPISRKLEWIYSPYLYIFGFRADMLSVGCPMEGAEIVLEAIETNIWHLNALRRELALRK